MRRILAAEAGGKPLSSSFSTKRLKPLWMTFLILIGYNYARNSFGVKLRYTQSIVMHSKR